MQKVLGSIPVEPKYLHGKFHAIFQLVLKTLLLWTPEAPLFFNINSILLLNTNDISIYFEWVWPSKFINF